MYLHGFSRQGNPNQIYTFHERRPDLGVKVGKLDVALVVILSDAGQHRPPR